MKLKSSHRVARASTSPSSSSPGRARRRAETDTRFDQNKSVFDGVQNATKLTLYEGLPHQLFERQELKQERASKPTIIIHHFPFYRETLGLTRKEAFSITGIASGRPRGGAVTVAARDEAGKEKVFQAVVRLNSAVELDYYRHGGILQRVLRQFAASRS